jgi:hypothetical protein
MTDLATMRLHDEVARLRTENRRLAAEAAAARETALTAMSMARAPNARLLAMLGELTAELEAIREIMGAG